MICTPYHEPMTTDAPTRYVATDSKGQRFEYDDRRRRKPTHAIIATYPALKATRFASAVAERRDATFTTPAHAQKIAKQARKQFGATDVEIVGTTSFTPPAEAAR